MITSSFQPSTLHDLNANNLSFSGSSAIGTVSAGGTDIIDYTVTDDTLLTGITVNCRNQAFGDSISLQVIDLSGSAQIFNSNDGSWYTVDPETVLYQLMNNWQLTSDRQSQVIRQLVYPIKLFAGVTLRLQYNSTAPASGSDVLVQAMYDLHTVLI